MRDVLDGMCAFTHEACSDSHADTMEILGVDRAAKVPRATASIVPFPRYPQTRRKA